MIHEIAYKIERYRTRNLLYVNQFLIYKISHASIKITEDISINFPFFLLFEYVLIKTKLHNIKYKDIHLDIILRKIHTKLYYN